ncbi:hypothetical protein DOZ80_17335 [Pseudomonas fluorescens]|uniref:Uncharacterized protein n=1 Tax=Pseudomonas fluorescens TaxID=294 RepID=A0A327MZE1_PSEFL|nr:hypothetical protein DOZ80_17335 [Pseudomonas fluorescens]
MLIALPLIIELMQTSKNTQNPVGAGLPAMASARSAQGSRASSPASRLLQGGVFRALRGAEQVLRQGLWSVFDAGFIRLREARVLL